MNNFVLVKKMKETPYKLHAAIFNSLRTLDILGASDVHVMALDGQFSRNLQTTTRKTRSRFIREDLVRMNEMCVVRWRTDALRTAATVRQILEVVYEKDGIPDVMLKKITFAMPWTKYNSYSDKNEDIWIEWVFNPYTFRKGVWKRLKAVAFPGQRLYERYAALRKEMSKNLSEETAKRWRDTLMMNKPNPKLDNQEIRQIWGNKPWALILKETRGSFDLMNVTEST